MDPKAIEAFKLAPAGATATRPTDGFRAIKMEEVDRYWMTQRGHYLDDEEIANWGYTLDSPAPTTDWNKGE